MLTKEPDTEEVNYRPAKGTKHNTDNDRLHAPARESPPKLYIYKAASEQLGPGTSSI